MKRGTKRMFWVEKIEKLITGGTSIRHLRIGTKSRLKMTLLKKGYFRTKKIKNTIEFYIFQLTILTKKNLHFTAFSTKIH